MNASWDSVNKYWIISHAENPSIKWIYGASWKEGMSVLFKGIVAYIKSNSILVKSKEGLVKEIPCSYIY
jgi:hypothetical protein